MRNREWESCDFGKILNLGVDRRRFSIDGMKFIRRKVRYTLQRRKKKKLPCFYDEYNGEKLECQKCKIVCGSVKKIRLFYNNRNAEDIEIRYADTHYTKCAEENKRKRDFGLENKIHCVYEDKYKLKKNPKLNVSKLYELFCTISNDSYLLRFSKKRKKTHRNSEEKAKDVHVSFKRNSEKKNGEVRFVKKVPDEHTSRLFEILKKNCPEVVNSNIQIIFYNPMFETPGKVDVLFKVDGSKEIMKKDGFEFVVKSAKPPPPAPPPQVNNQHREEEEDNDVFRFDGIFPNREEDEEGIDVDDYGVFFSDYLHYENSDQDLSDFKDIFGASRVYYSIACGNFNEVKKLVEENSALVTDYVNQEDKMGCKPLDVAHYYVTKNGTNGRDIKKFLEEKGATLGLLRGKKNLQWDDGGDDISDNVDNDSLLNEGFGRFDDLEVQNNVLFAFLAQFGLLFFTILISGFILAYGYFNGVKEGEEIVIFTVSFVLFLILCCSGALSSFLSINCMFRNRRNRYILMTATNRIPLLMVILSLISLISFSSLFFIVFVSSMVTIFS